MNILLILVTQCKCLLTGAETYYFFAFMFFLILFLYLFIIKFPDEIIVLYVHI